MGFQRYAHDDSLRCCGSSVCFALLLLLCMHLFLLLVPQKKKGGKKAKKQVEASFIIGAEDLSERETREFTGTNWVGYA